MKKLTSAFIAALVIISFNCKPQKGNDTAGKISKQDSINIYTDLSNRNSLVYKEISREDRKKIDRKDAVPHHLNYLYSQNRLMLPNDVTLRSLFLSTSDILELLKKMGKDPNGKGGFRIYPSKETPNSNIINLIIVSVDDNGVNTTDYMANTLLPCPDNCPTAKNGDTWAEQDLNYNDVGYNVRTGLPYSAGQTIRENERWLIPNKTHRFRWMTRKDAVEIAETN